MQDCWEGANKAYQDFTTEWGWHILYAGEMSGFCRNCWPEAEVACLIFMFLLRSSYCLDHAVCNTPFMVVHMNEK